MAEQQQSEASRSAPERTPSSRIRRTGRGKLILVLVAAVALLVWGGQWLYYRYTHVYTDDARIDGEVITISSRTAGWLTEMNVIEGDTVTKDQVLARVDARDSLLQREVLMSKLESIQSQMAVVRAQSGKVDQETLGKVQSDTNRLAAAEAEVASLEAQLKQARFDYERARDLTAQKWLSQQAMERARTALRQTEEQYNKSVAEVAAARGMLAVAGGGRKQLQVLESQIEVLARQADEIRAEIKRQEVDISNRIIVSPTDGRIVMTFVRKGEHVSVGQRILMFHDPTKIWVEANIKETDIGLLEPGMNARIRVDAYPDSEFEGTVHRIGRAATSQFALLPDPNPSGNFTKITQRLPVRILLDETDVRLRPGMMVEVDIGVRNR
ncbi:MAG: HlyD family efflux transporter periplasmic adaptor subunit [Betaproteobacteria bacterium]|nr:HlyD family efflux transporter periplasmic adaptor subunit [Betaproteobacteria bacterium]